MYEKGFEIVYNRLANAADVIVVMAIIVVALGVALRVLWKKIDQKDKDILSLTKAHSKAIEKEKDYGKERDIENLEAVSANTAAMVHVSTQFNELRNDIKELKNGKKG